MKGFTFRQACVLFIVPRVIEEGLQHGEYAVGRVLGFSHAFLVLGLLDERRFPAVELRFRQVDHLELTQAG